MNWNQFWNQQAQINNNLKQVGRVSAGVDHSSQILQRIVSDIQQKLALNSADELLDLCCGNGILSKMLADKCMGVTGVDFSEKLLDIASKINSDVDCKYVLSDIRTLELNTQFDKILLYFSFQYVESNMDANKVLQQIFKHLKPGGKALIGDIPDKQRFSSYYIDSKSRIRYYLNKLIKKNNMGRFWYPDYLKKLAENNGFQAQILSQDPGLPNSHYRFDIILIKAN